MLESLISTAAAKCSSRGITAVVSATSPEAALIGRDAFLDGGNAFDAVCSAALAETVLLPEKCGLAGDLVALCSSSGEPPQALVAVGPAAAGLGDAVLRQGTLPAVGGLSVGVPGAPAGYAALADLSVLGLAHAVQPAIRLATGGFTWPPVNDRYVRLSWQLLTSQNPGGTTYLPHGQPIPVGSRVALPGLADVLGEFADRQAGLFTGPIGEALVKAVQSRGGVITGDDLTGAGATWQEATSMRAGCHRVWATPLPTHGPSLMAALATAGDAPDAVTVWRAVRAAIADRQRTAGDTNPGGGTSVVAAADAEGNAVVVVHSNSYPTFGSGIVLEPYALVLANRAGRGFSATPGHPNFPQPGRRPITTLHAWALGPGEDGTSWPERPSLMGATPGGENQMPWNAQVIEMLLAGAEPAEAILAPRWGRRPDGGLDIEEGLRIEERAALARVATATDVPLWSLPSGMQILSMAGQNAGATLGAAADIRTVGGTAGL